MAKNPFGDIAAKNKTANFIDNAKVDGNYTTQQDRRGANYKNPKTGKVIKLGGKILQVPLNAFELNVLTEAASQEGLPLATFLRTTALKYVNNK